MSRSARSSAWARTFGWAIPALLAAPAWAATIRVTNGSDDPNSPAAGSLRDAVGKAQPGDVVEIQTGVHVNLTDSVHVTQPNVTIRGTDGASVTQPSAAPGIIEIVLDADGAVVRDLAFDHAYVHVAPTSTGSTVVGCTFKGFLSGVLVDGARQTTIGTFVSGEGNVFERCIVGVETKNTTDTSISNCDFKCKTNGVSSANDANLSVKGNDIAAESAGIVVKGSTGQLSANSFRPGRDGGTAVDVGKSQSLLPKDNLAVSGNEIHLAGSANGVIGTDVTDLTVIGNTITGRTSGTGIGITVGAAGDAAKTTAVQDNVVKGAATGVAVDVAAGPFGTLKVSGNDVTKAGAGGVSVKAGEFTLTTVDGNKVTDSGNRRSGFGMSLSSFGGAFTAAANAIEKIKGDAVKVGGTSRVDFDGLDILKASGHAMVVAANAAAKLANGSFEKTAGGAVFVGTDAVFQAMADFWSAPVDPKSAHPPVEGPSEGWVSDKYTLDVTTDGTVTFPAGPYALDIEVVGLKGYRKSVVVPATGGTIDISDAPKGPVVLIAHLPDDSPFLPGMAYGEARVKWGGVPADGGGPQPKDKSYHLSVTQPTTHGQAAQFTVDISNFDAEPCTGLVVELYHDHYQPGKPPFRVSRQIVDVPGGNQFVPGVRTVTATGFPPNAGKDQLFRVKVNGKWVAQLAFDVL